MSPKSAAYMVQMLKQKIQTKTLFFLVLSSLVFVGMFAKVLEASTSAPPNFPNCEDRIFTSDGDRAHYDFGVHGIPGVGNLDGSDDVYTLSDGNFLQCFCPKNSLSGLPAQTGIQSSWWNVKNLSTSERSVFDSQDWMYIPSGSGWGLLSDPYLVKNRNFSCDAPKVTLCHATGSDSNPFVTITIDTAGAFNGHLGNSHQSGEDIIPPFSWMGVTYSQNWDSVHRAIYDNGCNIPAPSLTPTPKPTTTPRPTLTTVPTPIPTTQASTLPVAAGLQSRCYDLEASPSEGTAPLTVRFFGHADDPASNGKIKEYRFDFADASGGQPQVVGQTDRTAYHRYELPGTYKAKLKIQDNAGNWRESGDCEVEIKVSARPQVLGATTPQVLPATGTPEFVGGIVLVLLPLGLYLYKRFKLV